jgi:site-specific DNA recombinase
MTRPAAIYARVSSDRQKENHTICSQLAALEEYAGSHGYLVPPEWRFQDEGYSGATLLRPGLEALRDLAAAGHIEVALVYSPDRLSRKYAYQVLLAEELSRCGVELVFLKAPSGSTPEDQLLVQFQGMIAEYERAQIAERSRRGKRHRAHQGSINVLSGAPYGYRYVKKSDTAAAYYEVVESEAAVVRQVYEVYTQQGLSINAIARMLNERQVPTRTETTRWERSTVWGLLRNPAYRGRACYGKTELRPRQRITRPLRQRNGLASRDSANHERPRQDWIEIAVPALVSEETFALAQEQLEQNKRHSPRRTIEPTLLQGMLVCERCGYGLYRTSTQTSARRLYYYRCIGSDAYRHLKGAVCDNPPVRQDQLDAVVWKEVMQLLEDPHIIQDELNRRLEAAKNADPLKQREDQLRRDQARLAKGMDRLLTAYQESLVSLEQLRCRMPELRQQDQAIKSELQSLETVAGDQAKYLRLVETLADFHARLQAREETLDVPERQKILRLLVKEVLVGRETITIRHSIRMPNSAPDPSGTPRPPHAPEPPPKTQPETCYLLRSSRRTATLGRTLLHSQVFPILQHAGVQPFLDEPHEAPVRNPMIEELHQPFMRNGVEKVLQIGVHDPLPTALNLLPNFAHGVFRRSPSPISEVGFIEHRFEDRFQPVEQRLLAYPVVNCRDSQCAKLARLSRLRDLHLPHRLGPVDIVLQFPVQSIQLLIELRGESIQTLPVHTSTAPVGLYHLPGHLQVLPLIHLVN